MTAHAHLPRRAPRTPSARGIANLAIPLQARWLIAGLVLAFAVPFLFADVLAMPRDAYCAVYTAVVIAFVGTWARLTQAPLRALLARRWRWAVGLGAVAAGLLVLVVLREPATPHPDGWTFAGAILWRGVVYGAVDGVLLSVFPILAVFGLFEATPLRQRRKAAVASVGVLALAVSVAFSAVYHLGYPDFRGSKLRKPVAGDVVWSAPTLLTLSPVGAPIAHVGVHVAAVVHSYDTDLFLPPH